jgi:acyl carrier protein
MAIRERLTTVFHDVFDDNSIQLFDAMTAADIEDWDSLTHINLVVATEKEFNTRFDLKEVKALKNVGEFISMIAAKTGLPA